jgi:hypothetical protein
MERLRDQQAGDPDLELAQRLVEAKRTPADPFLKDRVRARMRSPRRIIPRGHRLRPIGAVAALVVLGVVSVASAMVGRAVIRQLRARSAAPAPVAAPSGLATPPAGLGPDHPAPSRPAARPGPAPSGLATPSDVALARTSHSPFAGPGPDRPAPSRPADRPGPDPSSDAKASRGRAIPEPEPEPQAEPAPSPSAPARPRTPSAAESALVAEAYSALRHRHAAQRAIVLVDNYLEQFPNGALIEEALALGMEAAHATDPEKAGELAERYLESFPRGTYAHQARRLLSEPK